MINSLITFDLEELKKKQLHAEAKSLYASKILSEEQFNKIKDTYKSKLYSPSVFMRALFFILTLIGLSAVSGPIALFMSTLNIESFQLISVIFGLGILLTLEFLLIKKNHHYLSGVTEAAIYTGLSFIYFGVLGFDIDTIIFYPLVGLLLALFAAIRYLNLLAMVTALFFFSWILFQLLYDLGGMYQALIPFIFIIAFISVYLLSTSLEKKLSNFLFNDQFIIIQTLSLLLIYIAGNYFVVRELSISLMDMNLSRGENIPFAYLFYAFTALIPIGYILWGIKRRSLLFLRTGLLTIALSVITLKYYFSLGHPIVTITFSGLILISISLLLLNYLKNSKKGFTREKLLDDKWGSKNITGIIASETLGGNQINDTQESTSFNGGNFGGGGAGSNW
jgi:hypothetical protein